MTAGLDPDLRFLLANERTLLAWLRTGLALQAGGLAVLQFAPRTSGRTPLGVTLLLLGVACELGGWWRYRATDRAIRAGHLPKAGFLPDVVIFVTVVLSILLVIGTMRS
jgi:putative membrane protein